MVDLISDFEAEHIFASSLWDDMSIGKFLWDNGYQRNMLGNLLGLFADEKTVAEIQNLPDSDQIWGGIYGVAASEFILCLWSWRGCADQLAMHMAIRAIGWPAE